MLWIIPQKSFNRDGGEVLRGRSHNHWGLMMFGAILGAAATVMYYNQSSELSRVGSRILSKSKQAVGNTVSSMRGETDPEMESEM